MNTWTIGLMLSVLYLAHHVDKLRRRVARLEDDNDTAGIYE